MPFLRITTNISLEKTVSLALLNNATRVVAEATGKPESYVMVNVIDDAHLAFGAKTAPAVFMELKSVDLTPEEVPALSDALTKMVESRLRVPGNRTYIEFSSSPGNMWGFSGTTF